MDDVAWYGDNSGDNSGNNSGRNSHDVGTTESPNELGLYDMSGNVYEWCNDWGGDYSSSSQTNPKGAADGSCRVIRGGGWPSHKDDCRVSARGGFPPDSHFIIGLRLCH